MGYFFLSGLTSIAKKLTGVKDLRLLIGNTTNRETLEQLTEGYRRLELVKEAAEAQAFSYRSRAVSWTKAVSGTLPPFRCLTPFYPSRFQGAGQSSLHFD